MVVPADWIPGNELDDAIGLPMAGKWPGIDFSRGGFVDDGYLHDTDDLVKAGLHSWTIYGVLAFTHWLYYSDRYYFTYTMTEFGSEGMALQWRTWNGIAWWIRNLTKTVSWGITGLAWCISLIPLDATYDMFVATTTYLLMVEMFVIFLDCILLFVSFFAYSDSYEAQHQYYTAFSRLVYNHGTTTNWENDRRDQESFAWEDFALQGFALST